MDADVLQQAAKRAATAAAVAANQGSDDITLGQFFEHYQNRQARLEGDVLAIMQAVTSQEDDIREIRKLVKRRYASDGPAATQPISTGARAKTLSTTHPTALDRGYLLPQLPLVPPPPPTTPATPAKPRPRPQALGSPTRCRVPSPLAAVLTPPRRPRKVRRSVVPHTDQVLRSSASMGLTPFAAVSPLLLGHSGHGNHSATVPRLAPRQLWGPQHNLTFGTPPRLRLRVDKPVAHMTWGRERDGELEGKETAAEEEDEEEEARRVFPTAKRARVRGSQVGTSGGGGGGEVCFGRLDASPLLGDFPAGHKAGDPVPSLPRLLFRWLDVDNCDRTAEDGDLKSGEGGQREEEEEGGEGREEEEEKEEGRGWNSGADRWILSSGAEADEEGEGKEEKWSDESGRWVLDNGAELEEQSDAGDESSEEGEKESNEGGCWVLGSDDEVEEGGEGDEDDEDLTGYSSEEPSDDGGNELSDRDIVLLKSGACNVSLSPIPEVVTPPLNQGAGADHDPSQHGDRGNLQLPDAANNHLSEEAGLISSSPLVTSPGSSPPVSDRQPLAMSNSSPPVYHTPPSQQDAARNRAGTAPGDSADSAQSTGGPARHGVAANTRARHKGRASSSGHCAH